VRARNGELATQLRTAAVAGDDARISRLLSELLRFSGLPKGQRIPLQLQALLRLVNSLRAAVLHDELTGLWNRRGFMQAGTRLLDVAAHNRVPAWLVCFNVAPSSNDRDTVRDRDTAQRANSGLLIRQTGSLLRHLFPTYGVYEVLGRLRGDEFAALTTSSEYASRGAILLRIHGPQARGSHLPPSSPAIGVADFDPRHPAGIDELLQDAREDLEEHRQIAQTASTELTPPAGLTRFTASGRSLRP
jgi:GGDEF domain-containing protein